MLPEKQVPAGTKAPGVAQATPQSNSPVAPQSATPAAPAGDAAALEQLRQQMAQRERDLNALKSASQRREFELQQQLKAQQEEFQRQLHNANIAGMDEESRKQYESELAQEQAREMQQRLAELQQANEQAEGKFNAFSFFTQRGVPAERLTMNGTLEEMVQSGYDYMATRNAELEAQVRQAQTQAPVTPAPTEPAAPAPLPKAPAVDVGAGASSSGRPTWADIDREYEGKGGREMFYQQLQSGQIPAERLPLHEEPKA